MARIRSIKPEFFIDEDLQDMEAAHPGAYCMLVYAGLWGHCSKEGVFEYKPRVLKLSILPFLDFSMADTLALLEGAGFIRRFAVDGKEYAVIPSFEKHQRISGKEATFSPKFPSPPPSQPADKPEATPDREREAPGKHRGSTGEAQEGEGEKEKEKEQNQSSIGGGSGREPRAGDEETADPPHAGAEELEIESEVARLKGLHLQVCGLGTVPPVAIVQAILQQGKPVRLIDDIYQACGGDAMKYRQRNIVERLTALRDGVERSPPPRGGRALLSAAERRQEETFRAAREFAGGFGDDRSG
jgi:hypothetical protein